MTRLKHTNLHDHPNHQCSIQITPLPKRKKSFFFHYHHGKQHHSQACRYKSYNKYIKEKKNIYLEDTSLVTLSMYDPPWHTNP